MKFDLEGRAFSRRTRDIRANSACAAALAEAARALDNRRRVPPESEPPRELGPITCIALGLTILVGGGIYALPSTLAATAGPLAFTAFLGAAALVAPIGLMTAEAAGTTDRAGGSYAYARAAFGVVPALGVGWMSWMNTVLALSALSSAVGEMTAGAAGAPAAGRVIASAMILLFGAVNALGARKGAAVSNVLTVCKLVPLVAFVAIAAFAFRAERFELAGRGALDARSYASAVYACIFAVSGFETVAVVAREVRDPRRTIPRAVLLASGAATLLYIMIQIAATGACPDPERFASEGLALPAVARTAGEATGGAAFGRAFETAMVAGALLSMAGCCAGAALVAPRYLYAMAEDRLVPAALARTAANGTPRVAVAAMTLIAAASVWAADGMALLNASVLFSLIQHASTTLAAWKLRSTLPAAG